MPNCTSIYRDKSVALPVKLEGVVLLRRGCGLYRLGDVTHLEKGAWLTVCVYSDFAAFLRLQSETLVRGLYRDKGEWLILRRVSGLY